MNELLIFETDSKQVAVRLEGDTVWLTQRQMGELFGTTPENVLMHLKNIFGEEELDEAATAKDFLAVQTEGKRQVKRTLKHYNLDAIISVGYRVNSKRGVRFRQWATRVLREHLTEGYSLNAIRLAERGLDEARQAIDLLARSLADPALISDTGRELIGLIAGYAKTWHLLLKYDEDGLQLPAACQPARGILDYATARRALDDLKASLHACGEATDLFARERSEGLHGILGSIEQTMFGEPLYPSREEKAAHLFYFVIKDHPFADGNKRSAAFLLLLYLRQENMPSSINPAALTALTLLVAESQPQNKDLMIRLIVNLLAASAPNF
ncbi:virulence protein RhuM/Fic/DOC family protein [uncultured Zoogloea sp.]|jgi:prophage maintenance system killer protein|uniref:virulence protein RhuM/Fic/DOC family protein n=1 Tax=uncultured Zoogloea sp. TaxID=160237 RepID=UPI002621B6BD|nr:virulence protein RhuM/Fic/DOC family protein [uncultured Zoogloea sp.]